MANRPFEFEEAKFDVSLKQVIGNLKIIEDRAERAITQAVVEFSEHFLSEAQKRAPVESGALRAAATVEGPSVEDDIIVARIGFNLIYAAMRDQGTKGLPGGVLRPVRAKALFIPLRKGARPGDPTLKWGVDFVLAKEVKQKGNGFFTLTFEEMKAVANKQIGERVTALLEANI